MTQHRHVLTQSDADTWLLLRVLGHTWATRKLGRVQDIAERWRAGIADFLNSYKGFLAIRLIAGGLRG